MRINVNVEGIDTLTSRLNKLCNIENALLKGGEVVRAEAQANCPKDTGRLANSIAVQSEGGNSVVIGPTAEYGIYVEFGTLPAVSYYDLITTESFRADNSEQAQLSRVQIDIWAMKKTQPGEIAEKVNRIMQDNGWIRELGRDLPRGAENHVYHYTMRFAKEIYG